jgi:hypothetical protein
MIDISDISSNIADLSEASVAQALLQQLLDHLDSADAIQQALLGDSEPVKCYEFHDELDNLRHQIAELVEG